MEMKADRKLKATVIIVNKQSKNKWKTIKQLEKITEFQCSSIIIPFYWLRIKRRRSATHKWQMIWQDITYSSYLKIFFAHTHRHTCALLPAFSCAARNVPRVIWHPFVVTVILFFFFHFWQKSQHGTCFAWFKMNPNKISLQLQA